MAAWCCGPVAGRDQAARAPCESCTLMGSTVGLPDPMSRAAGSHRPPVAARSVDGEVRLSARSDRGAPRGLGGRAPTAELRGY